MENNVSLHIRKRVHFSNTTFNKIKFIYVPRYLLTFIYILRFSYIYTSIYIRQHIHVHLFIYFDMFNTDILNQYILMLSL